MNDEANLNVLDQDSAPTQIQAFDEDERKSTKVSLEAWQSRPWKEEVAEHAASLQRSQL